MKKVLLFQVPFAEEKDKSLHDYVIATLHRLGLLPENQQNSKKNSTKQKNNQHYTFSEWLPSKEVLSESLTQQIETDLVRFYTENFKFQYSYTLSFTNKNLCTLTFLDQITVHIEEDNTVAFPFTFDSYQEPFLMNKYYDACRNLQSIGWNPVAY